MMATLPLSLWVLVEVIFCVLMMMLEGIQNPGVRIQNLGGHLRAFFAISRKPRLTVAQVAEQHHLTRMLLDQRKR
jgi:hypothetical protein